MNILVCDDDLTTRSLLAAIVTSLGHVPILCDNGAEALSHLTSAHAPRLAVLDWEMPATEGIDVCRQVRRDHNRLDTYLILLTGRRGSGDIVAGLEAGANDYVKKPFDQAELRARILIGIKMVQLQEEVRVLSGVLPICAWCKKIRDESQQWVQLEQYVTERSQAQFTHGICPGCVETVREKTAQ